MSKTHVIKIDSLYFLSIGVSYRCNRVVLFDVMKISTKEMQARLTAFGKIQSRIPSNRAGRKGLVPNFG